MHHPYRFIQPEQLWQSSASSARSEQVEGSLAFLLSGAHIGFLPRHIAAPWEARGLLRALVPEQLGFRVQFTWPATAATNRARRNWPSSRICSAPSVEGTASP
ncbi:hypothetical protein D3C86_1804480 [compost metagenome]